jgi:hypothetical protein
MEPSAWGCNRVTLFLGDINTGTLPSRLGHYRKSVNYGHEPRRTFLIIVFLTLFLCIIFSLFLLTPSTHPLLSSSFSLPTIYCKLFIPFIILKSFSPLSSSHSTSTCFWFHFSHYSSRTFPPRSFSYRPS